MKKLSEKIIRKNLYNYLYIISFNLILYNLSTHNYEYSLMRKDQEIMVLTAAKMFYFDLNTYEAAWNHHTPPIFYLFKSIFYFFDFSNIYSGFFILYSFLLFFLNILLYKLIYKVTCSKFSAILFSCLFIFDISHTTVGETILFDNRTIGIFFQILILIYTFKIIDNQKTRDIVAWSIVVAICCFSLESYLVSIFPIYIYLIFKIKKRFFKISLITFFLISAIYSLILFINDELYETIQLNYIFHLFGTSRKRIPFNVLVQNGFLKPYLNWSVYLLATTLIIVFCFFIFKRFRYFFGKSIPYIEILFIYFFSEVIHLFVSGPRFTNYYQLILLFVFIIPIISLTILFKNNSREFLLLFCSFLLIFGLVVFDNKNEILLYRLDDENTLSNLTSEQIKLIDFLNSQNDGEIYLNYIWGYDNNLEVYFRTNSLPSTKMWWWFNMYYSQSGDYIFDSNKFYSKNLDNIFIRDLEREKPKYFIIEDNYISLPENFSDYLESNYLLNKDLSGYRVFKINR
jgi:hypothetical protein